MGAIDESCWGKGRVSGAYRFAGITGGRGPYHHPIASLPNPLPAHGPVADLEWFNAALATSSTWAHGVLSEANAARIGADYGFAGVVHRIDAVTADGESVSFVVKREERAAVERALAVREGGRLTGIAPTIFGALVGDEEGILVMEHVHPSTQGDVLRPCSEEQAESLIRSIARVHAPSFGVDRTGPRWAVSDVDQTTWEAKLTAAARNVPTVLDERLVERLIRLPDAVQEAVHALDEDEWCWIHADLHLDNVVFRHGAEAVILDWANARIGPPAVDLGHVLTEGLDVGSPAERIDRWLPVYLDETARRGVTIEPARLRASIGWSILPFLRGVIGWASRDDDFADRLLVVREHLVRRTSAWLDSGIVPIEI